MKTYFSTPERIAALSAEARSWLGTPFAAHAMVKGGGADCVSLVAGIFLGIGALKSAELGNYALDDGARLTAWFDARPEFSRLGPGETKQAGDVLEMNYGAFRHAALMLSEAEFIHVLPQRRVIVSNRAESFYFKHILTFYRLMEVSA